MGTKETTNKQIKGRELAILCAKAAAEIKAENIRVWDLRGLSSVTDFMVVCEVGSVPHLRAALREVRHVVEEWTGETPFYSEGNAESRWIVLDFIDVIVHVMHHEQRQYYAIEELWGDAKQVEWGA